MVFRARPWMEYDRFYLCRHPTIEKEWQPLCTLIESRNFAELVLGFDVELVITHIQSFSVDKDDCSYFSFINLFEKRFSFPFKSISH